MNESNVTEALLWAATQLTDRGNRSLDEAAVLEQTGGSSRKTVLAVNGSVMSARVDFEAARRVRDLTKSAPVKAPPATKTVQSWRQAAQPEHDGASGRQSADVP